MASPKKRKHANSEDVTHKDVPVKKVVKRRLLVNIYLCPLDQN